MFDHWTAVTHNTEQRGRSQGLVRRWASVDFSAKEGTRQHCVNVPTDVSHTSPLPFPRAPWDDSWVRHV